MLMKISRYFFLFFINNRLLNEHAHCDAWSEWSACSKTCDYGIKIRVKISTDQTKSKACSNITESTICHEHICPRTFEEAEETYLHNKEKEKKKKFRTTYILIFTIFSVFYVIHYDIATLDLFLLEHI
ncbi:hypothetical protein PFMC_00020 [Plasmodium falciparum CAMP/Malaysia]|uniref:CCN TSP1 domain-containing protein n=1 Tax=Plasmodium falciparum (isolate Camp / Malaysia) TaxID=5835 RepID=A0A024XFV2_PLAFC|nr:hypothetical protein PFMC_00020 [Plasmodium falciparum CAMP/Malaysia]